jgi:hypothetical protein
MHHPIAALDYWGKSDTVGLKLFLKTGWLKTISLNLRLIAFS